MIRRPPRSTQSRSSAASDVYKRQPLRTRQGLFASLDPDFFASIPDALALVVVRHTHLANILCELPQSHGIGTGHRDLDIVGHFDFDALRNLHGHGMRVPNKQSQVACIDGSLVADANDFETLDKTVGDAFHKARETRRCRSMHNVERLLESRIKDETDLISLDGVVNVLRNLKRQGTTRSRDRQHTPRLRHSDTSWNRSESLAYSRHTVPLPDEADDLAAKPFLASLHVGHQPLRGGDDCHTGAHENARYCILLHIDAAAWKTDTLQAGNVTTTSFCILEIELQVLAVIANDLRDTTNITLLLENQRECTVHLRIRGNGRIVEYQVCISHPGQEIRKCVNSGHVSSSTS